MTRVKATFARDAGLADDGLAPDDHTVAGHDVQRDLRLGRFLLGGLLHLAGLWLALASGRRDGREPDEVAMQQL